MVKQISEAPDKFLELSIRLNKFIGEYREQAVLIQNLLAKDDEDSLFKIRDVLNNKEALIKSYDQTALELAQEQALYAKDSVIPVAVGQELHSLEQERQAIFNTIRDIEKRSLEKISDLYNENRGHIKQIEVGKRLMNAYQSGPQVNDGLFIDRRK